MYLFGQACQYFVESWDPRPLASAWGTRRKSDSAPCRILEMTSLLPPRSQRESLTEMTEYVLPQHANALGNVFGGQIMAWIDLCAAITAQRHSGRMAVTAFVDDLMFENPVKVGEVVQLRAQISATFRTSMEIEVTVVGEHSQTRKRWPCVHAYLTFVCIDESGTPTSVPPLLLESAEVRDSQSRAALRREQRLGKQKS